MVFVGYYDSSNADPQTARVVIAVLFGVPSAIAFIVVVILLILLIRRKLLGNSHGSKDDIREHLVEGHVSSEYNTQILMM